jgi:hypothetical protein
LDLVRVGMMIETVPCSATGLGARSPPLNPRGLCGPQRGVDAFKIAGHTSHRVHCHLPRRAVGN